MKHIGDANGADGATANASFEHINLNSDHRSGDATAAVPNASLLFSGSYHQSGEDLIITKLFETVTIHNYFLYDVKPALVAPDGSSLSAAVVLALTEGRPGEQVAGDEPARVTAIGRVESATGTATVIRNGQSITLHAGDLVFKGDAVETDEHGSLAITFIDGTAFTLAQSARMVLNDMVYQPGGDNNSSLLSLVQGSITFVAGEVAHTGEMKVDTPVATMGIRGTAVHVNISANNGPTRFSVMREPDGRVGSYILYDHKSGAQLATVADVGNVVELQLNNGQIIINTSPKTPLDVQQEQGLTQQVFATFQAGQQDSLLHALTQTHDPSGGGSHGSSGPPQTGPSGGELQEPSGNQPTPPAPTPPVPQPQVIPSPPSHGNDDSQQPLPIVVAPLPAATAPIETIILAKNAAVESVLPVPLETVTSVQAANGNSVLVGSNGTTIAGLYGHLTIAADGSFSYVADHAVALGAGALGFDVFDYTVTNTSGSTATAALTFDVIGASNNPIVAAPVTAGTVSDKSAVQTINLLGGATSPNPNETVAIATDGSGHPAVQVSVSGPVSASVILFSVDSSGHLTIDPSQFSALSPTQSEALSFSYTLVDASGGATAQTATITIDATPTASYGAQSVALFGPSGSASETVTLTSAAGDPTSLDTAQLAADGWNESSSSYIQSSTYGTATLDANGSVNFALNGTVAPAGVATPVAFAVPFVDMFGVEVSANVSFTIDGAPLASYGVQSAPLLGTIGSASETITLTSAADDTTELDTTQLASDGWMAISGGLYTKNGFYGTATLDANGNVSFVLNGIAAPAGVATSESFTVPFADENGVDVNAIATFTIDRLLPIASVPGAQTLGVGRTTAIAGISLAETNSVPNETFTVTVSDTHGALSATGAVVSNSGTSLTLSGSLTQINNDLATLTDTDATPGTDTITIGVTDSFGNSATPQTIGVTAAGLPSISVPGGQTLGVNQSALISGIRFAESYSASSETFTVTVSDTHGTLAATGGVFSNSGTSLTLSGSLTQINTDLLSLTDTDATPGADTITIGAIDSFGNSATPQTISVTAAGLPSISVPGAQTLGVNQSALISGISLAESYSASSETFTVTVSDTHGTLAATGGVVSNSGTSLTLSGSLTQIDTDLLSLTDTDATPGTDTITIGATDSFGNSATQETTAVTTNGLPVITVPGPEIIGVNQTTAITGIRLSESGDTSGETFSATISDTHGLLSVTGGGNSVSGLGTTSLTITDVTLTELEAYRGSLTDTDATPGTDTITICVTDSFGNATQQTIAVTAAGLPSISVPGAQTLGVNQSALISGISLAESYSASSETFTVTVSDMHGALAATGGVVSNSGTSLTLSGSLTQIDTDLLSLTDTDATPGADTITIGATDSFGNSATPQTISVTAAGVPSISVINAAQALGVGHTTAITGISLAESYSASSETFTVTVSDMHGTLAATDGVVSNSGTSLTLSGSLTQIDTDLLTLTDTDATPGADTITIGVTDSFGNSATPQTISVTAAGVPSITVPSSQTLGAGHTTAITGISLAESYSATNETFTITVSDTHGALAATGIGVSGSGTTSLTLTGSLTQIYTDLSTLTDSDSTPGADTITIGATDSLGNSATPQTISVTAIDQNLVTNGGFETGDLTGWTSNGIQTQYDHVQTSDVHSGNYSLELGAVGGDYTLDQSISTIAGDTYQVEFWLTNPGGTPSDFDASFNGVTLLSLTNSPGQPYTEYVYDVTATSSTTDLHFAARQDPSFWYLDDISVASIGALVVAANATLGISNAVAAGTTVTFSGSEGTLDLDNPANFHGQIAGISGSGDVLDLSGFNAASTTAATGLNSFDSATDTTALTITDSQQNASTIISLAGDYSSSSWTVMSDGHGGVNIADPPGSETTGIVQTVPSGLTASVQSDGGNGDLVALTGEVSGSDDTGTIAWDQGAAPTPLTVTDGAFSVSHDLAAGDHLATLIFNDAATNTTTAQTIDFNIGGADAPFVFAPATNPAVLVGSASANVSQTLAGSAAYQDTIVAGAGNDTLTGNYAGGDTFVFKTNMGNDQITDLHTAGLNGSHDTVDVSAFHFANYQALLAATTTDAGGDATIALGTHTLTLDHVQKADLQSDLFHL